MTLWQNDTLTKWHFDKMTLWQNDTLTKWHFDKMTLWQNDTLTKWHFDKMTHWQNDTLTKWHIDKMTHWQNDTLTKWPSINYDGLSKPLDENIFSIKNFRSYTNLSEFIPWPSSSVGALRITRFPEWSSSSRPEWWSKLQGTHALRQIWVP